MKSLIFFLLILMSGNFSNTLSVTSFGATGNGTTDDTDAINACFAAAHTANKSVLFPPGTYLCNHIDGNGNILVFTASANNNITIFGTLNSSGQPTATILTTSNSASVQMAIQSFNPAFGINVSNLNFLNTHGKISVLTVGLSLQGTNGQNLDTLTVSGNSFNGFGQALFAQGVTGWFVHDNAFGAPHGHDDAMQNTNPATHMAMGDNSNGHCQHVRIFHNSANGYTGTLPMNCKRPMDGLLYGTGYDIIIYDNTTKNYSEEHLLVQPWATNFDTTAQTLIQYNTMDCSLPPGAINDDGTPHKVNYGIRSDVSNTTITKNIIKTYTWGILVYAPDYPTLTLKNYTITNNTLTAASATDTTYSLQRGILTQGNTLHGLLGVNIIGNAIYNTDTACVQTISATVIQNSGNRYSAASN